MRVLERDIEIGQKPTRRICHQRDQLAHRWIRVNVVQTHPSAELAHFAREIRDVRSHLTVFPRIHIILAIKTIGRGILRNHQQLLHATLNQFFRLAQNRMSRTRRKTTTHVRNDAKLALVITTLGNLQITVMTRCQRHARGRQQIHKRIRRRRDSIVHSVEHLLILMRACNGEDIRVMLADVIRLRPQTPRHDHFAILLQRFANRLKAFCLGAIEETAGVHDHRIRASIVGRHAVSFGAQTRQNAFAIHQRFGATKANHADTGLTGARCAIKLCSGGKIRAKRRRVLCHGATYTRKRARRQSIALKMV